jgi:hypothetical protein
MRRLPFALVSLGLGLGLGFAARPAAAQAPPFVAALDRAAAAPGEPFVYEVTLTLGGDDPFDGFRPPEFKGLQVLSAARFPNRAMSVQMGGGATRVENRLSWRFELALPAGVKGPVTIGPAHVRVGGRTLASNTVSVRVGVAGTAPAPAARQRGGGGALFPGALFPPGMADDESSEGAVTSTPGAAFIRAVADKPRVFVGEQVTVTWYLYLTEPQNNFQPITQPRTDGFWSEDLPSTNPQGRLAFTDKIEGGRRYQVAVLAAKALFPLEAGKLAVTAMEAEVSQVDFFGRPVHPRRLKAEPLTIEAVPLPREGQPAGFDPGNVGQFTCEVATDRAAVAVGDAVTLTLTVKGSGNVRNVRLPALPALAGWKSYEPKTSVAVEPGTPVTGTKTVEWLIRPERGGRTIIPAFTLASFDPASKRYVETQTLPFELVVTGETAIGAAAPGGAGAPSGGTGPVVDNVIGQAIRPIRVRSAPGRDLGSAFVHSAGFTVTVVVPPLAFAALLVGGRVRRRLGADTDRTRRRRLRSSAHRRLRVAEAHREAGRTAAFYVEIDRVLRDVLSERVGVAAAGLKLDELRVALAARGLPEPAIARVVAALEAGDEARFAPGEKAAPAALASAIAEAGALIDIIGGEA